MALSIELQAEELQAQTECVVVISAEGGDDKNYVHNQGVAATVWSIQHDLNKYPSVTVVDSALTEVEGDIEHIDLNNVKITFSAIFSGKAIFN